MYNSEQGGMHYVYIPTYAIYDGQVNEKASKTV